MSPLLPKGNLTMAVRSLRRNRGRSLLTMLGIIIGVSSVTVMVGLSEGIKSQISQQTARLGSDLITIRPGRILPQASWSVLQGVSSLGGAAAAGSLSASDLATVRHTPGVTAAAPLSVIGGGVTSGEHQRYAPALAVGTTPQLPELLRQQLAYGTFFGDDSLSANKVVIGSRVARELYDEAVPLGQTLSILGHQFVVVGIFDDFQTVPLSLDVDFNDAVFIPYATAQTMTNATATLYEILVRPASAGQADALANKLNGRLLAAHGGQEDFTVLRQDQTVSVADTILHLVTLLISGIAAISLLVGGIGIMNVMLVSVTERMHEIGIRKAIGATSRQILGQFMTEAVVLSVTGGALGILLALAVELALRVGTSWTPIVSWQVVALSFGISVGIGILFGVVPAWRAAHKQPIAALRNE